MYGFESVEEMLNMPALNLYANEKVRADMISLLSKQGKITDFICEGKRKDGTPFWVSMNVQFKYDIDGKITGTVGVVRDISERKQAEKVLVETSNRLNEVLENAIDASYKRNLHINSYEYLSPVFEKISGYTMVEMNSMSIGEVMKLMHPDDIAEAEKTVKNALSGSGGDSYEVIYRFKHKTDGNYRWILDKFTIMRDNIDNPVAMIGSVSDITKHKQAEITLVESEERYSRLLQNLEAGIVVHAPDTTIVMNNQKASELLGLSQEQMKGRNGIDPEWKFIHEDKTSFAFDEYPVNRIVKSKQPIKNQILGVQQPGKKDIVWLTVNGFPVLDNNGEISEIVISFIDITERKNAEQEIILAKQKAEESEEQLRAIFENSKDAIGISIKGISVMVNQAYLDMFGYDDEKEIIGKSLLNQIAPKEHNRIKEYLSKRYLGEETPRYYEVTGIRKNGIEFPLEINVGTYIIKNERYSIGIIRDITDRKNKELEIQKKLKDLQWHYDIAMQREIKMAELKKEINELAIRLGEEKRYGV